VVGTIGDVVVGYASVSNRHGLASLAELFTEPEARGVGVGDAMLRAAETLASQWGCAAIESVALPGDRDTKNFFEAHGMVSRLLLVSRTL
jgi:GNAT superfamily N-acetyltransferase